MGQRWLQADIALQCVPVSNKTAPQKLSQFVSAGQSRAARASQARWM
jgi:hypothetical protein